MARIHCALAVLGACLLLAACGADETVSPPQAGSEEAHASDREEGYAGSGSCRTCHERFYELWAPSHHGTAMQPYTADFAAAHLSAQDEPIEVADLRWQADLERGVVVGRGDGEEHVWPVAHVMGGKNVFFLLTPTEGGRLQVLPIAYDVDEAQWYDTTASMVRHAEGLPDNPVHWQDTLLTFNTSCWGCHVSQLSLNYNPDTNTYASEWQEPGINCETCHGPAAGHVRVCEEAEGGPPPDDLRIVLVSAFDETKTNDTCSTCHAKATVLAEDYQPGAPFFDHFDVACFEDRDFYPDGRDLGENYTLTLWLRNPCAQSGQLDCVHCHTSSGRFRFADSPNDACLPCHAERVADVSAHTHHPADSPGSECVACHMPMTEFARMRRSDHSMRPPTPALAKRFGSPDACILCHADQDLDWADAAVREWHPDDYQAPLAFQAELVAAARDEQWERLDEMLTLIEAPETDEVLASSLIRLLTTCPDPRKLPILVRSLTDPSPIVRASAAAGLEGVLAPPVLQALLDACGDPVRLVRIRAAAALAGLPAGDLPEPDREALTRATQEMVASLVVRPDSWSSWYNLGNYLDRTQAPKEALAAYEKASALRPDAVPPHVNAAMIHARQGRPGMAENALRRAIEADPEDAAPHFNLGLLLAERERLEEARTHLEKSIEADPEFAPAAYNLGLMLVETDVAKGLALLERAVVLSPQRPGYAWALALHQARSQKPAEAMRTVEAALARGAASADLYSLLAEIYLQKGDRDAARAVAQRAIADPNLPPEDRAAIRRAISAPAGGR